MGRHSGGGALRLEFRQAIERGTPARVTADDGIEALRIALAAAESARTGRVVRQGRAAAGAVR